VTLKLLTLIIAAILLTTTTAPTVAQNKTDENGTLTTENMTATETNVSGSVSGFHSYCPLSFC
jgi:hypothetical protein